jgi:flagellar biosynthesis protein FlhF
MQQESGVRIKSYFAASVEAAIEQARQELGSEAMLLDSGRTPADRRQLGDYEVVFGLLPAAAPVESKVIAWPQSGGRENPDTGMRGLLHESGLSEALAQDIAECTEARAARDAIFRPAADPAGESSSPVARALAAELRGRLDVTPELGRGGARQRIAALVGPPGAGKTHSLVKLAVTQGLALGRRVDLVSLEKHRVAAGEPLRSYASILDARFHLVGDGAGLSAALRAAGDADLILIDTPGYSRCDAAAVATTASLLANHGIADVHLVVPATLRPAGILETLRRFEAFHPTKLLFTHLDETSSYGALWTGAIEGRKPLSFLCAGQQIPEDIQPATREALVELLLGEEWLRRLRSAA